MHRHLLLFGFLALLSGCASPTTCPAPGNLPYLDKQEPISNCYYKLIVTDIDPDNNLVKGKVPPELAKMGLEAYGDTVYTFRLLDIGKVGGQIEKNKTNHFIGVGHSGYLLFLPNQPPEVEKRNE